jgi:hypothetical protein
MAYEDLEKRKMLEIIPLHSQRLTTKKRANNTTSATTTSRMATKGNGISQPSLRTPSVNEYLPRVRRRLNPLWGISSMGGCARRSQGLCARRW